MCGIIGVASRHGIKRRDWLSGLQRDGASRPRRQRTLVVAGGHVGLAQRRLAIIDLTPDGHQPMHDEAGSSELVFNGEIYNYLELREELAAKGHKFRTQSDTEVVLAGLSRVGHRLSRASQRHVRHCALRRAARTACFWRATAPAKSRCSIRPHRAGLRFASELKALLADPGFDRGIDPAALDCYLAMGYVPGERCILRGVRKLPPAHAMTFDLERRYRYLALLAPAGCARPTIDATRKRSSTSWKSLLRGCGAPPAGRGRARRHAAERRRRFQPGDGHGGAGVAARQNVHRGIRRLRQLRRKPLRAAGRRIISAPSTSSFRPATRARRARARWPGNMTSRSTNSSMIPTFWSAGWSGSHCTVALGGDGGDELFGGYEHHRRLLWMQSKVGYLPLAIRRLVAAGAARPRCRPVSRDATGSRARRRLRYRSFPP